MPKQHKTQAKKSLSSGLEEMKLWRNKFPWLSPSPQPGYVGLYTEYNILTLNNIKLQCLVNLMVTENRKLPYYKILAYNVCVCVCARTRKYLLRYSYVKYDIYTTNEIWEAFLVKYHSFFTTHKEGFRNFMMALKWQAPKIQIHTSGLIKISLKLKIWGNKTVERVT